MKKIIGLILTIAMVLTMSSAAFAATGSKTQTQGDFKKQLDAVAQKHGGKAVILNNVDPSTIKLHFDTIEEFDQALSSIKITNSQPTPVKSSAGLVSPLDFTGTFYGDHTLSCIGIAVATVRNRVYATEYWNPTYQKNLFSQVVSQSSYLTGGNLGVTWSQFNVNNNIIDGGRTVESSFSGTATLTATVGTQNVGYSWDTSFYDDFYAV